MAESAVASRSLEERERELAATNVAPAITVASEYDRHTETLERGEAEAEDPWAFAGENESIDSFIAGAAPSCTAKAWIATQHDERKRLVEEYYEKLEGVEGAAGRESMGEIAAAWEAAETKTLDTLTGVLKDHKYGCGKWMVRRHGQRALVVPQLSIQAAWDVGFGSGLGCSTHCRGALLQLRSLRQCVCRAGISARPHRSLAPFERTPRCSCRPRRWTWCGRRWCVRCGRASSGTRRR